MWRSINCASVSLISFLLTHPVWDVTSFHRCAYRNQCISTHTSRVGCDITTTLSFVITEISTHTSRVGCDVSFFDLINSDKISTHTSRVGCDWSAEMQFLLTHPVWDVTKWGAQQSTPQRISTHTSRVGCDGNGAHNKVHRNGFLLTHPVWDVTTNRNLSETESATFLLTHPVWDVTILRTKCRLSWQISTHTSRVGCDVKARLILGKMPLISTHTSRVGCDNRMDGYKYRYENFYSHIPCGMWLPVLVIFKDR